MEYFEPSFHPHYAHEHMSAHFLDAHQAYAIHAASGPMIAMPLPGKTNETKPRLGKDEVDILEREFKKNPKPSTQTKRAFAEEMGVELARINNWFQNRRAKRKQEKKQEACEAGQARETTSHSEASSPDAYAHDSNAFYDGGHLTPLPAANNTATTTATANTTFSIPGPPPAAASYNPQYTDPSLATIESFQRTLAAAQITDQHDPLAFFANPLDQLTPCNQAQFSDAQKSLSHYPNGQAYAYSTGFTDNIYRSSQPISEVQSSPDDATSQAPTPFHPYSTSAESGRSGLQPVSTSMTYSSQLLPAHDGLANLSGDHILSQSPEDDKIAAYGIEFDIESPSPPPAPTNISFKSPPPMDIASRRKKVQHKPAALTAETMRGRPSVGPRTVSQAEGLRRPSDSPLSSPMRRNVSAGGNRPVISGRIYKSGIETAQRSPINLGGFDTADTFIEHNYHSFRNPPSLTGSSSLSSSLAPPTPMSPMEKEMNLAQRDVPGLTTASTVDGNINFVFDPSVPGCFTSSNDSEDQKIDSPPETPQARLALQWYHDWGNDGSDEPLFTPGIQDTFPVELHMPQPSYLSSVSQPTTSAFATSYNQAYMVNSGSPRVRNKSPYAHATLNDSEFFFPDMLPQSGMSPSMTTKPKTFQFSHTTPADFSEK